MSVALHADAEVPEAPVVRTEFRALAAALVLHAGIATALLTVNTPRMTLDRPVEMEVVETPPPPPEVRPPPEPEPVPEPPRPKVVTRRAPSTPSPKAAPTPPAPPPPNQERPPAPSDAPPMFGVTMSSVVSGESAVAVPVGNTLMTKERRAASPRQANQVYAPAEARPFVPVAEVYVTEMPRALYEVNSADIYPPEAQKLGIEGNVILRVGIDETGAVREVRVSKPAGHGFDERARDALRKFKFSPARGSDGKPVAFTINYTYRFSISQ